MLAPLSLLVHFTAADEGIQSADFFSEVFGRFSENHLFGDLWIF